MAFVERSRQPRQEPPLPEEPVQPRPEGLLPQAGLFRARLKDLLPRPGLKEPQLQPKLKGLLLRPGLKEPQLQLELKGLLLRPRLKGLLLRPSQNEHLPQKNPEERPVAQVQQGTALPVAQVEQDTVRALRIRNPMNNRIETIGGFAGTIDEAPATKVKDY